MKPPVRPTSASLVLPAFGLIFVLLGTQCVGPRVHVVHRYALSASLDSAYRLPDSLTIGDILFRVPSPKKHWWSDDMNAPECATFTRYEEILDEDHVTSRAFRYKVEARINRGTVPSVDLWYSYFLPFPKPDSSTKEGIEQWAKVAESEREYGKGADSLVLILLAGSGASPLHNETRTAKLRAEQFEPWCKSGTVAFPDTIPEAPPPGESN